MRPNDCKGRNTKCRNYNWERQRSRRSNGTENRRYPMCPGNISGKWGGGGGRSTSVWKVSDPKWEMGL